MSVPEQVRKQLEAATQLHEQVYGGKSVEGNVNAEGVPPADDKTTENTEVQQAANETNQEVAPSVVTSEQNVTTNQVSEDFEHKYKTLKGMYSADITPLRRQNTELAQRVQQLENLLATAASQQAAESAPPVSKLLTDKEVHDYADSIDVMRKVSREELSAVVQRLVNLEAMIHQMQAKVVPQVQAVVQNQQMNAEQQFLARVESQVPNWQEITANEAFHDWLAVTDPLSNYTRKVHLEDALRNLDATRVIAFFEAWFKDTGQTRFAQPTAVRSAATELEKQVAPGRTKSSAAPITQPNTKKYTRMDITNFYKDVSLGKYKDKQREREAIERDIFQAQAEGRIV
jgi:BMFP domain-containing protein YqiC